MQKLVLMGPPGSGKGTQARRLKEDFDLVHISVGDIFRWNIQAHTKLAARIKRIIDGGKLVSDEIVESIVRRRLEEHDWNYGFLLDGFPRSLPQAEFLLETYNLDAVIHIDVPEDVVLQRVLSRRLCSECGLDYNLIHHRPAVADVCDVCGGRLVMRPDDTEDTVRERLDEYRRTTVPALELFRRKGLVSEIDGSPPEEEVQESIRRQPGLIS